jgi:hypothetical protein
MSEWSGPGPEPAIWSEPADKPGPNLVDLGLGHVLAPFYAVPSAPDTVPPAPTHHSGWGEFSATPVSGSARARKLAIIGRKARRDGLERTLLLRLLAVENDASSDPPLSKGEVLEVWEWVLTQPVEGAR